MIKPSHQALVNELHRVNATIEGPLKTGHMYSEGQFSVQRYIDTFGSWDRALKAADIDYGAQLLDEIERVAEQLGRLPSKTEMDAQGKVTAMTPANYFGGWREALKQTSLDISSETSWSESSDETTDHTDRSSTRQEEQSQKSKATDDNMNGGEQRQQITSTSKDQSFADTHSSTRNCDELVATLQSMYETADRLPRRDDLEETQFTMHDFVSTFGNWEAALEAVGIDKRSILLSEIEQVARELNREPTPSDMNERSPYQGSTYSQYFGSWNEALAATSLPDFDDLDEIIQWVMGEESSREAVSDDENTTGPSRTGLVEHLRELQESEGGLVKATDVQEAGTYSQHVYNDEFGSFDEALAEAGIDKRALLLAEFVRVSEQLGAPPTVSEIDEHGEYSPSMYYRVFDSWKEVKQAAREFASIDCDGEQETSESHKHDATRSDDVGSGNGIRNQLRYKHKRRRFETGS